MDDDRDDARTEHDPSNLMSMHVDDLDLTIRAHNCLQRAEITHVGELVRRTPAQLLKMRNMGRKTVRAINRALNAFGLHLGMRTDDDTMQTDGQYAADPVTQRLEGETITRREMMSMHVDALSLTVRALNCLRKKKITRVAELVQRTPAELLAIPNMGVTSVRDIQRALAAFGLRLAMSSEAISAVLTMDSADTQECDAFLDVMKILSRSGIDGAADVTRMTSAEVLDLPGLGPDTLAVLRKGLGRWGLRLCPFPQESTVVDQPPGLNAGLQAVEGQAGTDASRFRRPETIREELTQAVVGLLEDAKGVSAQSFLAYHGVDGTPRRTLQEIGDAGDRYGFTRPVTRERVRQMLKKTEGKLRARSRRMQFVLWQSTVYDARRRLPASSQSFASWFGYGSAQDPEHIFGMLRLCAEIFRLEFPFDLPTLSGLGTLVVGRGDDAELASASRLRDAASGPYADLAEIAARIGSETESIARIVEASQQLEFLDGIRRYFWKRPSLPPRNFAVTGNAILTSLCKVFSVATRATTADLALSIPRDRMLRKNGPVVELPLPALEGVAEKSGLFDVEDGQISRKMGGEWCVVGQRDIALLAICAEYGRVVPSHVIYSGLVRSGLTRENAAATVAYSPFLVHTQSGNGYKEGVYKFVVRPSDIDLGGLKMRVEGGAEQNGAQGADGAGLDRALRASEASEMCLSIPVSSRTRLSGRYFAAEPVGLDGAWDVRNRDGAEIGRVVISGQTVSGLVSVIDALGLAKDEVLEMRFSGMRCFAVVDRRQ